jgi:hypothetical protein
VKQCFEDFLQFGAFHFCLLFFPLLQALLCLHLFPQRRAIFISKALQGSIN